MQKIIGLIFLLILINPALTKADITTDQRALQTEIQNELACYCGCGMTIQGCLGGMICSESKAVSNQVAALLENGKSKPEILQALVVQYGERILAAPTKKGFNLTAWILPFVALVIGGVIVAKVIARWKQQTQEQPPTQMPKAINEQPASDPYRERVERELREFDS